MDLIVATKNKGKIKEIQEVLEGLNIRVLSPDDLGLEIDVKEDGKTYIENAVKKAVEAAKRAGKIALADDSGLEIDALKGRPGINSSRFAGDDADDRKRNLKILEMMKNVPYGKRGARFRCAVAIASSTFANGGQEGLYTCEGICEGEISEDIRGDRGFGYDPIFVIPEYGKTFGELGAEVKNKISHRAKALERAKEILANFKRD